MMLKTIAISQGNYEILKDYGRAGDSFNDVITKLIKKKHSKNERLQSDTRPGNQDLTAATASALEPVRSEEM